LGCGLNVWYLKINVYEKEKLNVNRNCSKTKEVVLVEIQLRTTVAMLLM
jgi:hypothetical protein